MSKDKIFTASKLQNSFLVKLGKNKIPISLYLIVGDEKGILKIKGFIKSADDYTILIEGEKTKQRILVFKKAIAFIYPAEDVDFTVSKNNVFENTEYIDNFWKEIIEKKTPITLRFQASVSITGFVKGMDKYTLSLELKEHKKTVLVYKSAISSIEITQ